MLFMQRNGVDTSRLENKPRTVSPISAPDLVEEEVDAVSEESTSDHDPASSETSRASSDLPSESERTSASDYPLLMQVQADPFINHAVWLYDAGTEEEAFTIAQRLAGKVCGLKLIRASSVDEGVASDLSAMPIKSGEDKAARVSRRKRRMAILAPENEERSRTLIISALPEMLSPRYLWGFFGTYGVREVKLLRRDRVASVVFDTEDEARRALRERSNFEIAGSGRVTMRMFS